MSTSRVAPLARPDQDPRTRELLDTLRAPGGEDLNIFTTLAHHPRLLKRWVDFSALLLFGGSLDPRDRELVILRTALLCDAGYEWGQHVPIAREAGILASEIARVAHGPDAAGWSELDSAFLRATDELHTSSRIDDSTWAILATYLDVQQLIELCMVVGQYHLAAFTLNSLGVEPEPGLIDLPEIPS